MNKKQSRLRRAKKTRMIIKKLGMPRVSVHRTLKHMYAQLIDIQGRVLAAASTAEKALACEKGGNINAAIVVGKTLAERAKQAGVTKIAFDRSGFRYHGRVKALADALREGGIEF